MLVFITGFGLSPQQITNTLKLNETPLAQFHEVALHRFVEEPGKIQSEEGYRLACLGTTQDVLIVSNSDPLFNGMRRAVYDDKISSDQVRLYFIDEMDFTIRLQINEDGRLPHWPTGFFDQFQLDLSHLIRPKKNTQEAIDE